MGIPLTQGGFDRMNDMRRYADAVKTIKSAILQSRYQAARIANKEQLLLYYNIGHYVSENTRSGKWGTGAIEEISRQLQLELLGLRGFSVTTMKYMRTFYEAWSGILESSRPLLTDDLERQSGALPIRPLSMDELQADDIAAFLQVGFTHHREILMRCPQWDERWYYIKRCAAEFWSVERLKSRIRANDFAHEGALANNFSQTIPDEKLAARAVRSFKDEYLLDFINIEDEDDVELIDERVLEKGIVTNIKKFILSFGEGFCFVGSQHRVIYDEQEFFCDILFFNRSLNCLVAVELKMGAFKPSYLGQLSFYLSALDEVIRKPHENKSIGLLLCKDAKKSVAELSVRDYNRPMGIAVYKVPGDIPEEYQSLKPLIEGVQELLSALPDELDAAGEARETK
jgi:predicted nuclease of restriction endonuclease-like (RecB) superfamily